MKVSCSRKNLAERLGAVVRSVSVRSGLQILGGVRLDAREDTLELAATDMELSLRASLPADVEGPGAVVVPGRLLVDLARLLPEGSVRLEQVEGETALRVTCKRAEYRLRTYTVDDFPSLADLSAVQTFKVEAQPLLETVARVSRAASRDESRPVLTGILVRLGPGKLVMAATDSYRLAVKETPTGPESPEFEAIVPARALEELRRITGDGEYIDIGVYENQLVFGVGGYWLTTRRIDGQFPAYEQLMPSTFEHEVRLSRGELLEVVRRGSVLAQRGTPLRLRFCDGEVTVSAQAQDIGESRETLRAAFTGEPLEIGFNAEYLYEGIESVGGDELVLKLINPLRPGLIQGATDDFWYLIMPIRLAG